jgi:hypothetical protein
MIPSGCATRRGIRCRHGPAIVPGIDAIDVTTVGTNLLASNHSKYAENRLFLNDIGLLMRKEGVRQMHAALRFAGGMATGTFHLITVYGSAGPRRCSGHPRSAPPPSATITTGQMVFNMTGAPNLSRLSRSF